MERFRRRCGKARGLDKFLWSAARCQLPPPLRSRTRRPLRHLLLVRTGMNKAPSYPASYGGLRQIELRLKRNFTVVLIAAALGVGFAIAEVYWLWAHGGESDATCDVLKLLVSFSTLWLLAFLLIYYRRKFVLLKATNALLPQDTLLSSGIFMSLSEWSMLPEALLCLIHPVPFINFEITVPYYDLRRGSTLPTTLATDELLTVGMMFARLALIVHYMPYLAGLTAKSARAYANMNHMPLTTWLSIRVMYQRYPFRLLGGTTALLLLCFGFTLQVRATACHRGPLMASDGL